MVYIWDLDPVAISLLGFDIRWYGLAYLAGFFLVEFLGWWGYKNFHPKPTLDKEAFSQLVFGGFIAGVLGGRLGSFLFYSPSTFWNNPLEILQVWHGGMSIHGGILAVTLYGLWHHYFRKINWLSIADIISLPLALGLFLGRIANFINGELYGRPTDQTWGVVFPHVDDLLRHPSQLYEAGKNIFLAGIILYVLRKGMAKYPGRVFGLFLAGYGILRFGIEYVREPNFYIGPLTMGQVLCTFMVGIGMLLFFTAKKS